MDNFIKQLRIFCLLASTIAFTGSTLSAEESAKVRAVSRGSDTGYHGVSEHKLNAFAAAYVKVARIYSSHARQVESAQNAEQAYEAQTAIDNEMSQAIQEEGLSPDEYNAVVRNINENPALGQAVAQKIRALQ